MDEVVEYNSGNSSSTKGINRFSDLTQVEFERSMLGYVSRGKATEAVSGQFVGAEFISAGSVVSLSEQALVDCSGSYGNQGCNGGLMDNAFKFVKAKGIPAESSYPYTGRDGNCKSFTSQTKLSTFTDVTDLETALVQQPISVAVDANKWSPYKGGVFKCSGRVSLDHGVLLVGSYSEYWVVKNSWGSSWGENGFIRLSKASGSNCGITQAASYPTI